MFSLGGFSLTRKHRTKMKARTGSLPVLAFVFFREIVVGSSHPFRKEREMD